MSELETPLAPALETASEQPVEQESEQEVTETPATPDYSKLIQREQMERSNLNKRVEQRFDRIESLLEKVASGGGSKQVKADRLSEVESLISGDSAAQLDAMQPGMSKALKSIIEELREQRESSPSKDVEYLREVQKFNDFMAEYPPQYRKDYVAEQVRLQNDLKDQGIKADTKQLEIAMGQWFNRYVKEQDSVESQPEKKRTAPASSGGRVIPVTGGARTPQQTQFEKLRNGRGGNLLGIKMPQR